MREHMTIQDTMITMGRQAREASRIMAALGTGEKNAALQAIATSIDGARARIAEANAKDLAAGRDNGLDAACSSCLLSI